MVFLYILFQSKLKAQISYTYHPVEVFILFYFHHKSENFPNFTLVQI